MQNLILLHLREQKGITLKDIEQRTGISGVQYAEYEQGVASIPDTDAELLSSLFKIKAAYLREYSRQLEYFSYSKSLLSIKDKRIEELVTVLKLYISGEPKPKLKRRKTYTSKK